MRRIAVINQKGGVGKTTTTVNLGAALARKGRRVVLVDLDPQANLTVHLGIEAPEGSPSMYPVLLSDKPFAEVLRPTSTPGLRLAPSNLDLSGAEVELVAEIGRETRLRDALERWTKSGDDADFVLIDCPPSLGLLSMNALVAADEVFLAAQTEFFALRGLTKLLELVELVKRRLNPSLEVTGVIAGLYDARRNLAREILSELRAYFGAKLFATAIRENVRLAEAPSHGKSIFEYAPDSKGAADYLALAGEVLGEAVPAPTAEAESAEVAEPAATAVAAPGGDTPASEERSAAPPAAGSDLRAGAPSPAGAETQAEAAGA
ncbi:MAG TPA: ParA family protein [Planctomycetota bacterium]|nr:ParA family protein [Planctomycetota bacterium]